jgi:hypothetical protein
MTEDWIKDHARRHREEDEQHRTRKEEHLREKAATEQGMEQHFPTLWSAFGESLRAAADSYNREYGRQALFVEVHPDSASIRGERGGMTVWIVLRANIATGSILPLLETRDRFGGTSSGSVSQMPRLRAMSGRVGLEWSDGDATLNSRQVADVLLREMLTRLSSGL